MAWTTPTTFATGNILSSSTLNAQIRDNMNYVLNGKNMKTVNYLKAANWTFTTTHGWTVLDGTNLHPVFDTTFSSGRLFCAVQMAADTGSRTGGTTSVAFDLLIDATYYMSVAMSNNGVATAGAPNAHGLFYLSNPNTNVSSNAVFNLDGVMSGLSAGTGHYVDVVTNVASIGTGGTDTVTIYGTDFPISITLIEL